MAEVLLAFIYGTMLVQAAEAVGMALLVAAALWVVALACSS